MRPYIDYLVVTLVVGDEAHCIVVHHLLYLLVSFLDDRLLFRRDDNVTEVERQAAAERHVVTHVLDIVKELGGTGNTAFLDHLADDRAQRLLRNKLVHVTDLLGYELVEQHAAYRGILYQTLDGISLLVYVVNHHAHRSMQRHTTLVVGDLRLLGAVELEAFTLCTLAELGDVVQTEHHVL